MMSVIRFDKDYFKRWRRRKKNDKRDRRDMQAELIELLLDQSIPDELISETIKFMKRRLNDKRGN